MNEINKDIRGRIAGYMGGAFGLVAGIAWNEAITSLINVLFPLSKDLLIVKFLYAIVLTFVVVVAIRYIERLLHTEKPN